MKSKILASLSLAALAGCALTGEPRYNRPYVLASDSSAAMDGAAMDGAAMDGAAMDGAAMDGASGDGAVIGEDSVAASDAVSVDRVVSDDVNVIGGDATTGDAIVVCAAPLRNCDDQCVDLQNNPRNCGRCSHVCPSGPNSTPTCSSRICTISCQPGFADCDEDPSTGCETNTQSDVNNCGGCGRECPSGPGGRAVCVAGACQIACEPGRLNCDGNPSNGCEALALSNDNCGSCRNSCGSFEVCTSAAGSAPACIAGPLCAITDNVRCGPFCVDIETDVNNCGGCGRECPSVRTREPVCNGGRCLACPVMSYACNAGPNRGMCCTEGFCRGSCTTPAG